MAFGTSTLLKVFEATVQEDLFGGTAFAPGGSRKSNATKLKGKTNLMENIPV
jgi:hypothetical protein